MYPLLEKQFELRLHPADEGEIRQKGTKLRTPVNGIATEILEKCDGKTSFETICRDLSKKHNDTIKHVKDLTWAFLKEGKEKKFISFHKKPVHEHMFIAGSRTYFSPLHIDFELTYNCNLKCKHCYANASSSTRKTMVTSDVLKILIKLKKAGVTSVLFTGGEATLHPGLIKIIDFASTRFENVILLSNGWNISETFAQNLRRYTRNLSVQISLDGKNAETHDYIRGRHGSFHHACHAIQNLSKYSIFTTAAMLVTPFNVDQIEETCHLAKKLGAKEFRIGRVTPSGRAKHVIWELSYNDFIKAKETIRSLSTHYGTEMYIESWEGLITDKKPTITAQKIPTGAGINCGAGHRVLTITPTGNVTPCSLFSEKRFVLGNMLNQNLKTVLGSSKNWFFYKVNVPSTKSCGDCKQYYKCIGCLYWGYLMHTKGNKCLWGTQEFSHFS